jgi:hypothetical protein
MRAAFSFGLVGVAVKTRAKVMAGAVIHAVAYMVMTPNI